MASAGHQQHYRSHSSASSGSFNEASFNGARSPHLGNDDDDDHAHATSDSGITVAELKANWRQIQELTRCVGSTLDERGCDAAFREYAKVKEHAELCRSLLSFVEAAAAAADVVLCGPGGCRSAVTAQQEESGSVLERGAG
uniref:Uncharacterized protein n=1 Tax=Colletotrichum fructicola (strain Nara gc5) TaxID=1213859 RepID=L2G7B3_COLFN